MTQEIQTQSSGSLENYFELYEKSVQSRNAFWQQVAGELEWDEFPEQIVTEDFGKGKFTWFADGTLTPFNNIFSPERSQKTAIIDRISGETLSYEELAERVRHIASCLEREKVTIDDRVLLIQPVCLESLTLFLACVCLGAVPVPVPELYSTHLINEIIADCKPRMIFVSNTVKNISEIEAWCTTTGLTCLGPFSNSDNEKCLNSRNFFGQEIRELVTPASLSGEHTLYLLYAHSSAGNLKGFAFKAGGYLVQINNSFKTVAVPDGHTVLSSFGLYLPAGLAYGFLGPLLNGKAIMINPDTLDIRSLPVEEDLILLTSPPQLRVIKEQLKSEESEGHKTQKKIAQIISTKSVLSPSLAKYISKRLLNSPSLLTNLLIQSQSGAALIHSLPHDTLNAPGSLGAPALGVDFTVLTDNDQKCQTNESGQIVVKGSWPAMAREILGRPGRFKDLYFSKISNCYNTNDGGRVDAKGLFWFMGRLDDLVSVSEYNVSSAEIESLLHASGLIREVVVVVNDTKELIAFVVPSPSLSGEKAESYISDKINEFITDQMGQFACPKKIHVILELPRTRTGKLARSVLRKIASKAVIDKKSELGHISNPEIVEGLLD